MLQKYRLTIIGILLGTIAGYLYYHYIGCTSGTCPISSKPLNSSLYGAVIGGLFFHTFQPQKTNPNHDNH